MICAAQGALHREDGIVQRTWLVLPAAVVLASCASQGQFDRNAAFSESSSGSLVVLGVDIQSDFKNPALVFRKYDPQTGKIDPKGVVTSAF